MAYFPHKKNVRLNEGAHTKTHLELNIKKKCKEKNKREIPTSVI